MEKEFVPYELAVKLKELGFDVPCLAFYYIEEGEIIFELCNPSYNSNKTFNYTSAPLWQQAFDWFREKYKLEGCVTFRESADYKVEGINSVYYDIEVYRLIGGDAIKVYKFEEISDNYYEARLQCLKRLIEISKKMKNNNGWIKIESEDDLPTDSKVKYWGANENGFFEGIIFPFESISIKYKNKTLTHYQPIQEPKPPLY